MIRSKLETTTDHFSTATNGCSITAVTNWITTVRKLLRCLCTYKAVRTNSTKLNTKINQFSTNLTESVHREYGLEVIFIMRCAI